MPENSVLEIVAYGAWNGGDLADNSIYEQKKLHFKGGIPVNNKTILIANKLITNVHERGNCSVVCMQRLPYDLKRGALQAHTRQGFKINGNLDRPFFLAGGGVDA